MRKLNKRFAQRWSGPGAGQLSHKVVNDKQFQIAANALLGALFRRAGLRV